MLPGKELLNLDELLLFMHGLYLSKDTMFDSVVRLGGTILLYKIGEIHLLAYSVAHGSFTLPETDSATDSDSDSKLDGHLW